MFFFYSTVSICVCIYSESEQVATKIPEIRSEAAWRHRFSHLWYQTDVDVTKVLSLHFKLELPEGLDERHALDVSHGAS